MELKRKTSRLLLVDQNGYDLRYYSWILEAEGFEVVGFTDCAKATTCLLQEDFDLVVAGQKGPDFELAYWSVVSEAAKKDPKVPVLLLTRFVNWDCVLRVMRLGAVGCHQKALGRSKLTDLVTRAVWTGRPEPALREV